MKILKSILYYNIILSFAAILLTISAQIQLGFSPQFRPYFILIFFATLFEYNKPRIITFLKQAKEQNQKVLISFLFISIGSGVLFIALKTQAELLIAFLLLGLITTFYSFPFSAKTNSIKQLREIPYLKIFLIAFVWSALTIFLPVIDSGTKLLDFNVILLFTERFFFIFSISIPFDIRDIDSDKKSGLKTLPILINKNNALLISYFSLLVCVLISLLHYQKNNSIFILLALSISIVSTAFFLNSKNKRFLNRFYYHFLDGSLAFQGILVLIFYLYHN